MLDMRKVNKGLESWRKERMLNHSEFNCDVVTSNLLEEQVEYLRAKTIDEKIDALCDLSVFSINGLNSLFCEVNELGFYSNASIYQIGYHINSIGCEFDKEENCLVSVLKHCRALVESFGYDYEKCMLETIKEISSRVQDPVQKEEWQKTGPNGKWQKWKVQPKDTLYTADYEACKIQKAS